VSTQWERGDRQAAIATLAEAVTIAEGDGRPDRASALALSLAKVALAARTAKSGERPAVRASHEPQPTGASSGIAISAGAPRKSTVSGERPAVTAKLGRPAALLPEPGSSPSKSAASKTDAGASDEDPFLFNGWSDSEIPAERADVVTARLAPEVVAAARARMKQPTANVFRAVSLATLTQTSTTTVKGGENPTFRPPTIDLSAIAPFSELPDDIRQELAASAEIVVLAEAQELSASTLVLIMSGTVDAISEHDGFMPERFGAGRVVSQQRLRSVGGSASLAMWRSSALDAVLSAFPSVRAKLSAA